VFENRGSRRIFGAKRDEVTGEWRKLRNEEFNDLFEWEHHDVLVTLYNTNSVGQHNHFITQGNYKVTFFDYRLVILRPNLSIVSQDAMYTLGSQSVHSIL